MSLYPVGPPSQLPGDVPILANGEVKEYDMTLSQPLQRLTHIPLTASLLTSQSNFKEMILNSCTYDGGDSSAPAGTGLHNVVKSCNNTFKHIQGGGKQHIVFGG